MEREILDVLEKFGIGTKLEDLMMALEKTTCFVLVEEKKTNDFITYDEKKKTKDVWESFFNELNIYEVVGSNRARDCNDWGS